MQETWLPSPSFLWLAERVTHDHTLMITPSHTHTKTLKWSKSESPIYPARHCSLFQFHLHKHNEWLWDCQNNSEQLQGNNAGSHRFRISHSTSVLLLNKDMTWPDPESEVQSRRYYNVFLTPARFYIIVWLWKNPEQHDITVALWMSPIHSLSCNPPHACHVFVLLHETNHLNFLCSLGWNNINFPLAFLSLFKCQHKLFVSEQVCTVLYVTDYKSTT